MTAIAAESGASPTRVLRALDSVGQAKWEGALVCVSGMHRSGTSMVARALQAAGMYLGPEERLMPPGPDNPEGFYEHLDLVRVSDRLLEAAGGGWDAPPPVPPRFWDAMLPSDASADAIAIMVELEAGSVAPGGIGWKDPRVCLTLPFWRALIPSLRVIVCLRDPMAVARSLLKRGNHSIAFGLRLWEAYNAAVESALAGGLPALVTHYDAWLAEPEAEARRVLEFAGLALTPEGVRAAVGAVRGYLRHQDGVAGDELLARGGQRLAWLYERLCRQAGPAYARAGEGPSRELEGVVAVGSEAGQEADAPPAGGTSADTTELLLARRQVLDMLQRVQGAEAARERCEAELARVRGVCRYYPAGTVLRFAAGANGYAYLDSGWGEAEGGGVWSVSEVASLRLVPSTGWRLGPARVRLLVRPFVGRTGEPVRVALWAGGCLACEWTWESSGSLEVECVIPQGLLRADTEVEIELRIANPSSPKELGLSPDERRLGVFLQEMVLEPGEA